MLCISPLPNHSLEYPEDIAKGSGGYGLAALLIMVLSDISRGTTCLLCRTDCDDLSGGGAIATYPADLVVTKF